jgi:hypothetical protein
VVIQNIMVGSMCWAELTAHLIVARKEREGEGEREWQGSEGGRKRERARQIGVLIFPSRIYPQ